MEEMRKAALAYYSNLTDEYKQKVRDLFRKMDANGDGSISVNEYANYLQSQKNESIADPRIFRELDKDGNGTLDFDEFITFSYIYFKGRLFFCDGCGVFLKGLYFSCVQCFDTRSSFDLCCDCFQLKNYTHHPDAVFDDNYVLLRSRSVPSSRTSPSEKIKKFLRNLDVGVEAAAIGYHIEVLASDLCNTM